MAYIAPRPLSIKEFSFWNLTWIETRQKGLHKQLLSEVIIDLLVFIAFLAVKSEAILRKAGKSKKKQAMQ